MTVHAIPSCSFWSSTSQWWQCSICSNQGWRTCGVAPETWVPTSSSGQVSWGLKMRSSVVNWFLIPNKRKQYKQKETNQHIQFHFSFSDPINKMHVKTQKKMHLLHSHQKRSQTRETWTFGTKDVRSSIRADGGCDSCSSVDHGWVGHLKLEGFRILNAWTYWFLSYGF